jgi:signal transduction histidine kinase/ActR/RegA family two-component response regulator
MIRSMKIRPQLAWMMAAIVAPLALVAALSSYALYQTQREVHSQRYVERVRALRLALDSELAANIRLLEAFASRDPAGPAATAPGDALASLLAQNTMWATATVLAADGRVVAQARRRGAHSAPLLDEETRLTVLSSRQAAVSGLVPAGAGGGFYTFVAVPEVAGDQVVRIAAIGIDQRDWLGFLRRYEIAEGATLTLNDQHGTVIARTLNNEQWVGKKSRREYLDQIAARQEGAMRNESLEGQAFYSAFSRLSVAPWTLGTGVPADTVEGALRRQTLMMVGGLVLAGLVAAGVAMVLGGRIIRSLQSLAAVARLKPGAPLDDEAPLPIAEAESVRRQLRESLVNESRARTDAEQAREQAERVSRGKDEFLAMLAHELRNPLSAISASVALLEATNATPQTDQHAKDVLKRQVRQMSMLVNDLLDAARASSGRLALREAEVDLAQVTGSVVQAFKNSGRTRHISVSTSLQPVRVRGDAMRLEQVVANLLDNAAKFTPAGGQVHVTLAAVEGQATLTVTDTGAGIAPGLLRDLFDPFTQAEAGLDRARGGLGLGLHVVKGLVELHRGSDEARSEGAGKGASFIVRLPSIEGPAADAAGTLATASEGLPPMRVALIEDNADVNDATSTLLRSAGHEVYNAFDGHSGLQLLLDDPPEVALIDVGLPGLSGLEVARRLPTDGTIMLALTAYGDEAMRDQARLAGFDGFLQKPFDLQAFEQAVQEARRRKKAGAEER